MTAKQRRRRAQRGRINHQAATQALTQRALAPRKAPTPTPQPPAQVVPDTVDVQVRTVTPDQAAAWLEHNTHNRRLSTPKVAEYAADMRQGRWQFTGQTIQFDTHGTLIDGQHRLTAQVEADATLQWVVVTGVDTAAQDVTDTGKPRTTAGQLQIEDVKYAQTYQSASNLILRANGIRHASNAMRLEHIRTHRGRYDQAVNAAQGVHRGIRGPAGIYAAAYWQCEQIDHDAAEEFFTRLADGVGLPAGSPILLLRNTIIQGRLDTSSTEIRLKTLWMVLRAWNYWRDGRTIQILRQPTSEVTPH